MLRETSLDHYIAQETSDRETDAGHVREPDRQLRKNWLSGRDDLQRVYQKANDAIVGRKVLLLTQFEELEDLKRLTICNLWRIERLADGRTQAFEVDITNGEWNEVTTFDGWPAIPLWPIRAASNPDYWVGLVRSVVWTVLQWAGFNELPKYLTHVPKEEFARHYERMADKGYFRSDYNGQWRHVSGDGEVEYLTAKQVARRRLELPPGYKPEMTPNTMAGILIARYTKQAKRGPAKAFIGSASMRKGARALRACLWQHIIDREVVSSLLSLHRDSMNFSDCLDWAVNRRESLLRVRTESRNLLPLLACIKPEFWHRSDLFSRRIWVRGGRKSTLLDRSLYSTKESARHIAADVFRRRRLRSFESKAGWRWLSSASLVVVRTWAINGMRNCDAINIAAAAAGIKLRIPVLAQVCLLQCSPDNNLRTGQQQHGVSLVLQHIYRLYLSHVAELWKSDGFAVMKQWIGRRGGNRFTDVMDYLSAEGFAAGYPNKNSTWPSLERHSADWHTRVAIANLEKQQSRVIEQRWHAHIPEFVEDGIHFHAITDSKHMALEGYEMKHCVGSYTGACIDGRYRVYSVVEADGTRSTLGLSIKGKNVSVEQHRGKHNGPVSPSAQSAGLKLASAYASAARSIATTAAQAPA
ncbi:PcfJ domain-containing protein [Xanthomonas citri]|uniref:PcfJ domain-containing protein n=1 Tax=Xanthomonas citri TaxID=346 RepID=UPI000CCEBBE7|nr:PcfJ domain-containing protein [Xanthomonas citri]PNV26809.1 hypothetical protein xavtCFBP7764_21635 [Xanthomonas citri]